MGTRVSDPPIITKTDTRKFRRYERSLQNRTKYTSNRTEGPFNSAEKASMTADPKPCLDLCNARLIIAKAAVNKSICPSWNRISNGYDVKKSRTATVANKSLLSLSFRVKQRLTQAARKNTKYVIHHNCPASWNGIDAYKAKNGSNVGG